MPGTSPASRDRRRRVREALDQAHVGRDRNRDAADQQPKPSHGDKSKDLPGTSKGLR